MPGGSATVPSLYYGISEFVVDQWQHGVGDALSSESDALDYKKLCMGEMGGLLPRTGLINTDDQFRSAVMVAWKFASLSKDAFIEGVGGIKATDKWQLVYPLTDMTCVAAIDRAILLATGHCPAPTKRNATKTNRGSPTSSPSGASKRPAVFRPSVTQRGS